MQKVQSLLRSTEYAIRTYQRAKLWRDAPSQYRGGQVMPSQLQEILSSPVILPSPYLEQAIQGFQQALGEYRQVISELEQALPPDALVGAFGVGQSTGMDETSMTRTLPLVISHLHDYFTHVAARIEKLQKAAREHQGREQGREQTYHTAQIRQSPQSYGLPVSSPGLVPPASMFSPSRLNAGGGGTSPAPLVSRQTPVRF